MNARTFKKVMEAKARKKRRFKKTMQSIVKKAEATQGSSLMTEREKQDEIKKWVLAIINDMCIWTG